jgi:GNAT superfamily N-acetyltransferase
MLAKPSPQWTIRQAESRDLEEIRSLYKAVWGYNRPDRYDNWRYLNSVGSMCPVTLAVDGENLAGAYTVWPIKIRLGDRVVSGAQSVDTMTHPNYRGQGIFTKLAEACYEISAAQGVEVLYAFPNPLSYPGFIKRLGWTHTGDVTHWIRFIKPSKHPRMPRLAKPFADFAVKIIPQGRRRGLEICAAKPSNEDLEELLESSRTQAGLCQIERTPEWFSWRYSPASENNYQWVSTYRQEKLEAVGVWGYQNNRWGQVADNRAHLVELLGDNPKALEAVLSAIITQAMQTGVILLETVSNIDQICRALRRAGFYSHRQAPLIIRLLGNATSDTDILEHDNWHITGGDVDTF